MKKTSIRVKEILFSLVFLTLFFISPHLQAQYQISYDVKQIEYGAYAKNEGQYFDPIDRMELRRIEEVNSYVVKVSENGERETTIVHGDHKNKYPQSLVLPAKTVIDSKETRTYDNSGKITRRFSHNSFTLEKKKGISEDIIANKLDFLPKFSEATNDDVNIFLQKGAKVKRIKNNGIHVRLENRELLYDHVNRATEDREFEGKDLKHSFYQKYDLDKTGRNFPTYTKETTMSKNQKGRRIWHFREEFITNYKISLPVKEKDLINQNSDSQNNSIDNFATYPNPASRNIYVQIPTKILDQNPVARIIDVTGRILINQKINYSLEAIDIETLQVGIYVLQVSSNDGINYSQSFSKQ